MSTATRSRRHASGGSPASPASPPGPPALVKLDFGCGPNPKDGYEGVDRFPFGGKVRHVLDVTATPWPWADSSVEAAHASHFLEHLTNLGGAWERVRFFNELWRVLKPGAKCDLVFPHWCSNRYYGDPTHKEPFSEMGFYYLSREWRLAQAPHADAGTNPEGGYSCDFEATWGYALHPSLLVRNQEYQQNAVQFYKEAAQDVIATLTCRKG